MKCLSQIHLPYQNVSSTRVLRSDGLDDVGREDECSLEVDVAASCSKTLEYLNVLDT